MSRVSNDDIRQIHRSILRVFELLPIRILRNCSLQCQGVAVTGGAHSPIEQELGQYVMNSDDTDEME